MTNSSEWMPDPTDEPSVAQWARAEGLHEARELYVAAASQGTAVRVAGIEALAQRWAKWIQTGEADG